MSYGKAFISVWLVAIFLLGNLPDSRAQQPKKLPRIGFLSPSSAAQRRAEREAFWLGMADLGYIEGQIFKSNTVMPKANSSACRISRRSWPVSIWTRSLRTRRLEPWLHSKLPPQFRSS